MMRIMIVRTAANTIYAVIGPSQVSQLEGKPNAYMSELRNTVNHHVHTNELTKKSGELVQRGRHFADVIVDLTEWYHPPRGHFVDTYA